MDDFVADTIFIDATSERVFSALLEPEELLEWLEVQEARVARAEGGEFTVLSANGSTRGGTISELVDGERLKVDDFYYEHDGVRRGPMTLTFTIRPEDYGVWITVRQDSLDRLDEGQLDGGAGWKDFADATRREWVRATVSLKRWIEQI